MSLHNGLLPGFLIVIALAFAAVRLPAVVGEVSGRVDLNRKPFPQEAERPHEVLNYRFLHECAREDTGQGLVLLITDWWPVPDLQFWLYPRALWNDFARPTSRGFLYGVRADDPDRIIEAMGPPITEIEREVAKRILLQDIRLMCGDVLKPEYLDIYVPKSSTIIGLNTTLDLRGTAGFELVRERGKRFYFLRRIAP